MSGTEFTVRLSRPFGGAQAGTPLDTIIFDGQDVVITWTTEIPGGFGSCQIGGQLKTRDGIVPMFLPDPVAELVPFAHVEINAGIVPVFEGQAVMPDQESAIDIHQFRAQGYWSALNDDEFISGDTSVTTSGAVLRQVMIEIAPFLRIGTDEQFRDPMVSHAPADFSNMTGGAIWDAITQEGNGLGYIVDLTIWDHRTIWAQIRIPPARPHYRANGADPGVSIHEISWMELYNRARTRYTDADGNEQLTDYIHAEALNIVPDAPRPRSRTLAGGQLTESAAIAVAQTFVRQHARRQYAGSITLDADMPLSTIDGGVAEWWQPRAGQWVAIDGLDEPLVIVRTEHISAIRTARLELGDLRPDHQRELRRIQRATRLMTERINPVTGFRF